MIGNIIAYTIVAALALPGALGVSAVLIKTCKGTDDKKAAADAFWSSILLLGIALALACWWGI